MITAPVLLLETVTVIVAGIITDSPLVSAIIGGVFLIVSAGINSVTLYLIARDERKRDIARTKKRNRRGKAASHPEHRGSTSRGGRSDPGGGGSDRQD